MDEYQVCVSDSPAVDCRGIVGKNRAIAEAVRMAAQLQLPVYVETYEHDPVFTAPRNAQAHDAEQYDNLHSVDVALSVVRSVGDMLARGEKAILALGSASRSLEPIDRGMATDLLRQQASLARSLTSVFGPVVEPEGIVPLAAD